MKGVKSDAAAVWIIEGVGQQVIYVNQQTTKQQAK